MKVNNISKIIFIERCKGCGKSLEDGWKFCPFCNNKVEKYPCPNCGNEISELWQFCPFCKSKITLRVDNSYKNSNEWLTQILKDN